MKFTTSVLAVGLLGAAGLAVGAGSASAHVVVARRPLRLARNSSFSPSGYRTSPPRPIPSGSPSPCPPRLRWQLSATRFQGGRRRPSTLTWPHRVNEGDFEITDPVTSVSFTADSGTTIPPGAFADFELQVRPLPDVGSLTFPTDQKYDDGSVVKWADPTPAGGQQPAHPSPTMTLAGTGTPPAP